MEKNQKQAKNLLFSGLVNGLISSLPQRAQHIITKRFGLSNGRGETLEKIGEEYGITRERVRQIIADSLKRIAQKKDEAEFKVMEEKIIFAINSSNGIIRKEEALEKLGKGNFSEENSIKFIVECSRKIKVIEEKGSIEEAWFVLDKIIDRVKQVERMAKEILKKEDRVLEEEELVGKITSRLGLETDISEEEVKGFLRVFSEIKENKFGKWGMAHWAQIAPKGTRDKIYLVLKENKKPLHFTEIAKFIDKYNLSRKRSHPQTVHNELIKDKRFVLVGRGIYALTEWGYKKGTIKEVIQEILSQSGSLNKDQVLEKVFQIRKVKKSTVMINLNNAKFFKKVDGCYSVKK